jgi:hypothetical protein
MAADRTRNLGTSTGFLINDCSGLMRCLALLVLALVCASCSTDPEPAPYPHTIRTSGSWLWRFPLQQDSLSFARITRADMTWMGRSTVIEVSNMGPEALYVSYDANGDISFAYASDEAWISLPVSSRKVLINPELIRERSSGDREITSSTSQLLDLFDTIRTMGQTAAMRAAEVRYTRKYISRSGAEIQPQISWRDTLWWSSSMGFFGRATIHHFTPDIEMFTYVLTP